MRTVIDCVAFALGIGTYQVMKAISRRIWADHQHQQAGDNSLQYQVGGSLNIMTPRDEVKRGLQYMQSRYGNLK